MNEHLMDALLHAALFLETSSDDECDPDLAVKQLEQISRSLRAMSPSEQDRFRSYARQVAERHHSSAAADEIRNLVDGLLQPDGE